VCLSGCIFGLKVEEFVGADNLCYWENHSFFCCLVKAAGYLSTFQKLLNYYFITFLECLFNGRFKFGQFPDLGYTKAGTAGIGFYKAGEAGFECYIFYLVWMTLS